MCGSEIPAIASNVYAHTHALAHTRTHTTRTHLQADVSDIQPGAARGIGRLHDPGGAKA